MTLSVRTEGGERQYRYLLPVALLFTGALIVSNIIAIKVVNISGLVGGAFDYFQPASIIIFPVAYIVGDILTEVYGYSVARRVIWSGFFANALAVVAIVIAQEIPAAPFWGDQDAYEAILGQTWRIVGGSFTAILVGEFANSFVLARLKQITQGRFLWLRTISSTFIGQGFDSAVFLTIAFFGTATIANGEALWAFFWRAWLIKTVYEVVATPLTYLVVNTMKRLEGVDVYDTDTNFNPIPLPFGLRKGR
ncbi:MAG: transporter [Dehalococcoidia bacterium]|nr:transporter [Dehalococcoidia bacterium]